MTETGRSPTFLALRLKLVERGRKQVRRLYVIAAAGLAAMVPLILFAGFWVRSELNKGQRDVQAYLGTRASAFSRQIDAELEHQLAAMQAVSALPALDDGSADAFLAIAHRVMTVSPHWTSFGLVDMSGRVIAATRGTWPDPDDLKAVVERSLSRKPLIAAEFGPGREGRTILLSVPIVRDEQARFALVSALDGADLQDITARQSREGDLLTQLVDGDRLLARSRVPGTIYGQRATERFRQATAGQPAGMIQEDLPDVGPVTGAFVRSPLTGWVSSVSIDSRQLDRVSSRSIWATIAAGVLSLVVAGILAVFIVHTVMERRVSDERLAASQALGDLDARLLATTQEALGEQRKAASEREVLLREIYHRVKNNLQIVQSLMRLGSRDLKPDQREPFENAVRRVGAMARVHTLLYNSPDLASIDFKDYLEELLKELSEGFGADERSIVSSLEAHSTRVSLDTAVPLAFIAVEILTNSYRHAFPDGRPGRITVDMKRDEPFAILRIEDDGIGIAADAGRKRRLGLTIVRKLVQQIGGSMEEPEPGSSSFVIRFPIGEAKPAPLPEGVGLAS